MRRYTRISLLVTVVLGAALAIVWPRTPQIVQSLRALPEVAKVEYTGPADADLVVIHLRDYHFVPREQCDAAGIEFDANLATVEKVQDDELAIARHLIRAHGVKAIYSEGLTEASVPDLRLRLDVLKDLERLAVNLGRLDRNSASIKRNSG